METNATNANSGRPMFAPLAKAIFLVLGMLALGYFAVLADTNAQRSQGGFTSHAAASQVSHGFVAGSAPTTSGSGAASPASTKWDVSPYVDPKAKVAEPIASF